MHRRAVLTALTLVGACRATIVEPPAESQITVSRPGPTVSFAAIGDYGQDSPSEAAVASSVRAANPDIVITLGDNNYPNGTAQTIDANVGKHYASFIAPYRGGHGPGAEFNRFFPVLGNHDWRTTDLQPYLEYFELPGNERYYDFEWGPVHFFALDSDPAEPDGTDATSVQARWLREALTASTAPWQVVYMHHPPYSSGEHGSTRQVQWPLAEWGADLVLAGHDHHYERIEHAGSVFVVNGLGGMPRIYEVRSPVEGSVIRFNETHGALFGEADATSLQLRFVTADGRTIDTFELRKEQLAQQPAKAAPVAPTPAPADFDVYED